MPAFKVDYRLVRWTRWLIIIAGLGIWAVRRANNARNYREVAAEVERIDEVCVPLRASVSEATDCATASARAGGKRLRHYRAV
ncbi:MAG TPA: hypothetical protein VM076_04880, partial [Gemmatimonadaceae bacterium]|nr:hypothetical protein [Gemmatimonadaceae bacterium]